MQEVLFSFMGRWSYLGLLAVLLAAGLGLPLPEDIPLIGAGYLVHRGEADLTLMIITGLVGVLLGDSVMYAMGRLYGLHVVEHRWFRRIAKPWLLEKAKDKYHQHGNKILFAARFMPGLRAIMFLTAGVFRVPYWKFLTIDALAALVSVPLWIIAGAFFGQKIHDLLGGARTATHVIVGLFVAALIIWGFYEYYHNLRRRNGQAGKEPLSPETRSAPVLTEQPQEPIGSLPQKGTECTSTPTVNGSVPAAACSKNVTPAHSETA